MTKFTAFRPLSIMMQYTKVEDYIGTVVFRDEIVNERQRQCERRKVDDGG